MNWPTVTIAMAALCLIAVGVWLVYPPAAFIVTGALLWFDLSRMSRGQREQ